MRALQIANPYDEREVWATHLQTVFDDVGITSSQASAHVSEGLAVYCQVYHPNGVCTSDLSLLIARTFCSIGDHASAEKILARLEPHRRYTARWIEILSELHNFPDLLPYFTRGIVRPADWAGAKQDRMWTLDFDRLDLEESERHEIMLYRTIRTISENMLVLWDAVEGEGTVGVKGLLRLKVQNTGRVERRNRTPAGKEWIEYIADFFRKQIPHRGWRTSPKVISLDL